MSVINELLSSILNAVYGEDMRQAIHDAIKQCYSDAVNDSNSVVAEFGQRVTNVESDLVSLQDKTSIIRSVDGQNLILTDSADALLSGLRAYGRTSQVGVPSLSNPIVVNGVNTFSITLSDAENTVGNVAGWNNSDNNLHGLKVSANGNFTDYTGQQWICDDVEFMNKTITRRISKCVIDIDTVKDSSDGSFVLAIDSGQTLPAALSDEYRVAALCSSAPYNEPDIEVENYVEGTFYINYEGYFVFVCPAGTTLEEAQSMYNDSHVVYILDEPVVEEIDGNHSHMKTFYPTTKVSVTSEDVYLSVAYNADATNYLTQQFTNYIPWSTRSDIVKNIEKGTNDTIVVTMLDGREFSVPINVASQINEALKAYIPNTAKSDIVSSIEKTEGGIKIRMMDGYEQTVQIDTSNAKEFETVEYDTETCLLHFYDVNGEDVFDPVFIEGGGGSSSVTYSITFKNMSESRSFSVTSGTDIKVLASYSSVDEDGVDDGPGVGTIYVGGVRKGSINITQGQNEITIPSKYLSSGANTVKIKAENSDGLSKSITYSVTVIELSVTTTLSQFAQYTGDVIFYYRAIGSGTKIIHFLMDGVEIDTAIVEGSGRSSSYTIPAQSHGGHIFECYATTEVDGVEAKSDSILLGMIWIDASDMNPAIVMLPSVETATQGEALRIPFMAYDPMSETPVVTYSILYENGNVYSSSQYTIDRTAQEWVTQDYPTGNVKFRVSLGDIYAENSVVVYESEIKIETISDGLVLDFNPAGRSNQEDNPAVWTDGTVSATFSDMGFAGSDGWLTDASGSSMLRLLPGGEVTIPYQFFASDKRDNGATIEVEMATHNVRDYDSIVISSMSGGRGIKIASQYAEFKSEQSEISMQFVEDKRVRVTFVIEPKNLNRLIYVYVKGIMCGAIEYPEDDNFAQSPAAGITIGAESSGIDVYRILMYDKGLVATEIVNNYIADRPTLRERQDAYTRNNILNDSGEIVINKIPATLPYMIIHCAELPQYKGDKKTCSVTFINLSDTSRSFTADGVEIDVQGTSSAGYKKKNFKLKFKNGLVMTIDGSFLEGYSIRSNSIPVDAVCMKADVASSEGANNVELVRLYNDVCPYKTAAQLADGRARVGIDGIPCVIFWDNTTSGEVKFWGKYNFNNEKSNHEVYGLKEGCESWEIRNNTSNRVVFKESDYSTDEWKSDFEARYPEDNVNYTNLKRMTDWLVSTDRSAVSSESEKQARLTKFKNEFEDYFVKVPMIFYYVFTETFLMVDNRAKNFFPTTYDGLHWMPLPYDMDTALGINNEGQLVFDYDLEDTDTIEGATVYNGQDSVLWCNIRDAFGDDIKAMYAELRSASGTLFCYDKVIERFNEHQSVWPETVWNEDAYEKNLEPLLNDNDGSYLEMLQGDKESQRDFWTFNRFRYLDSKYECGDSNTNYITLRCYAVDDITVTPYSHIYPRVKYGSYTVKERGKRNVATTLKCPIDTMNDTEVYVYSADRLADIGDLSGLNVGYANFTHATKLQKLKLGDAVEGYRNTKLTELYTGNNTLLVELDVRNCIALKQTVDLSGCTGIERIYAAGSSITGVTLPVGGKLKYLQLPNTVANITIRSHKQFETLECAGYNNLTTFRIEDTPNVPIEAILVNATSLERVRLVGIEWTATDEAALQTCITRLKSCGGLDASMGNLNKAVVNGRVYIDEISNELLEDIYNNFPELVVVVDGVANYLVRYIGGDGSVLYKMQVSEGGSAIDPVAMGYIETPIKTGSDDVNYVYSGWGTLPTNIKTNVSIVAQFTATWAVRFYNEDALLDTQWIVGGQSATDPVTTGTVSTPTKTSTDQYSYTYAGWDISFTNITKATNVYAKYTATLRTYDVKFYNGTTLLETVTVQYGSDAEYNGTTPVKTGTDIVTEDWEFTGWNPSPDNITGTTSCYAQFKYTGYVSVPLVERTLSGNYVNETVESVGGYAFKGCAALTSVDMPNVTSVDEYAFSDCTKLNSIDMPNVTSIGGNAFEYCNALTSLSLPNLKSVGAKIFGSTSSALTELNLPLLEEVSKDAFNTTFKKLESISLPSVTTVLESGFAAYDAYGDSSLLKSISLPKATSIGTNAFSYRNKLSTVNIPKATSIGRNAFIKCTSLAYIDLPCVTTLDGAAFSECTSLTSIDLPLVTVLNGRCFEKCSKLTTVILRSDTMVRPTDGTYTSQFDLTPIEDGTGYIYVPAALVETYKTNWSIWSNQFRALEDYTVDGTTTGELDETKINAGGES